jgi:hypothetical protein
MEPGQVDQYYFQVEEAIENGRNKRSSAVEVILGNIKGEVNPKFYRCNAKGTKSSEILKQCQVSERNKESFIGMEASRFEDHGTQKRYWFQI